MHAKQVVSEVQSESEVVTAAGVAAVVAGEAVARNVRLRARGGGASKHWSRRARSTDGSRCLREKTML
jgi:hypothetical protein